MNEHMNIIMAKEGNPEAFRKLYEQHSGRIYRIAFLRTRSRADAEDILQETFIKTFKKIRSFRFDRSRSFAAWLNTICINCTMDFFRRQKRRHKKDHVSLSSLFQEIQNQNPSPESRTENVRAGDSIREALTGLTPKQRLIFEMRYRQHMKIKDIAQTLDCSQSNVKTHAARSVAKLRKALEPIWRQS